MVADARSLKELEESAESEMVVLRGFTDEQEAIQAGIEETSKLRKRDIWQTGRVAVLTRHTGRTGQTRQTYCGLRYLLFLCLSCCLSSLAQYSAIASEALLRFSSASQVQSSNP